MRAQPADTPYNSTISIPVEIPNLPVEIRFCGSVNPTGGNTKSPGGNTKLTGGNTVFLKI
jgi:hypothetical protein